MAVVTTKSSQITNRDSTPVVLSNDSNFRGMVKSCTGSVASANGDSANSLYIHGSIPSNARVVDAFLYCDALGGAAAADIGLYDTTANGAAVVSGQFFAAGQTLVSALTGTNIRKSAINTVPKFDQYVWQVLGLASDPNKWYDVVTKLTAASAAAGNVCVDVKYV